ncbi:hypothetical protein AB5N19_10209 [Seiridium cardinale]
MDVLIFRHSLSDELLMLTQLMQLASLELLGSYNSEVVRLMLDLRACVLPRIRRCIEVDEITDGLLRAIHILSIVGSRFHPSHGLFEHPMQTLGITNSTGAYILDPKHQSIFRYLLRRKGGISSVQTLGMAEIFQDIDIISASHTDAVPDLDLSETSRQVLRTLAARRPLASPSLDALHIDGTLKEAMLDIITVCGIIDDFCVTSANPQHKTPPPLLLQYRNIIQHRLLRIPPGQPDCEICRLTAMIFVYATIWPYSSFTDPDYWNPMKTLSEDLRAALVNPTFTNGRDMKFLWWANMW